MTATWTKRLRTFWANPVVTRDLRVRMRGSKSYWHQAFYLLLLGLLALAGYGTAVGGAAGQPGGMSAVDVQRQLQSFYYFIFLTLAALITLIAPALTAVSITTERQRLSLDLLVTTPLSASELLVGKMISSVAFLALLLALSLPASALCVILGGATLGDVARVYLLLAIDGLVLAAIGLAVSCAVRASLPALVWSYLLVIVMLILTAFSMGGMISSFGRGGADVSPAMALGVLDPFVAVYIGGKSFLLLGHEIPLWVGASVAAFFLIRLLVTAATYRMGRYGGNPIGSLRRQLLLVTGLAVFCLAYSVFKLASIGSSPTAVVSGVLEGGLIAVFLLGAILLPSLFTPAADDEDDPPGQAVVGRYALRQAFRPEHSGALPYFHLWLFTVAACVVLGAWLAGAMTVPLWPSVLMTCFYLSGLGFLFWALARRAAALVLGVTAARALSFVLFAVLAWFPIALLGILYAGASGSDESSSPLAWVWILYPLVKMDSEAWRSGTALIVLLWSGVFCYGLGVLAYPFRRDVVPGGHRRKEADHVTSSQS